MSMVSDDEVDEFHPIISRWISIDGYEWLFRVFQHVAVPCDDPSSQQFAAKVCGYNWIGSSTFYGRYFCNFLSTGGESKTSKSYTHFCVCKYI